MQSEVPDSLRKKLQGLLVLGGAGLQACNKSLFLFVGFSRREKVY